MARPSETTVRRLFALSGNRCAFPQCSTPIVDETGIVTGEICHIRAHSRGGPRFDSAQTDRDRQSYDNLILLCRLHHKIVDANPAIHTTGVLQDMKRIHETTFAREEQETDAVFAKMILNDGARIDISSNSGNVAINSPGVIQGKEIHVRTSRPKISINPPPGTIGCDQQRTRYVQYLVSRYNKFASADRTRPTKFGFGAISKNIEAKFGASWKLLPIERFDELCDYLHGRINRTIVAKSNAAEGGRAYSSFSEFLKK